MPIQMLAASEGERPTIEDISRRGLLVTTLTAAVFAACGDDASDHEPDASPSATYPRTVRHRNGDVRLEARPQRVLSFSATAAEADHLLDFGVTPVLAGGVPGTEVALWRSEMSKVDIFATNPPDAERAAAADIDLVITRDLPVLIERSAPLARLAPVVAVPDGDAVEQVRILGELFAMEERAQELIAGYNTTINGFKPAWRPKAITYLGQPFDLQQLTAYTPASGPGGLFAQLGIPLLDKGASASQYEYRFSLEQLREYESDLLLINNPYDDAGGIIKMLQDMPVFQSLPVVQRGRARVLERNLSIAMSQPSTRNIGLITESLTRVFKETA